MEDHAWRRDGRELRLLVRLFLRRVVAAAVVAAVAAAAVAVAVSVSTTTVCKPHLHIFLSAVILGKRDLPREPGICGLQLLQQNL